VTVCRFHQSEGRIKNYDKRRHESGCSMEEKLKTKERTGKDREGVSSFHVCLYDADKKGPAEICHGDLKRRGGLSPYGR